MPMSRLNLLLLLTCTALVCPAHAVGSAMGAYKRKELALLHDNCKSATLFEPMKADDFEMLDGWVWKPGKLTDPRGTWVRVDVRRNQATSYKWEVIDPAKPRVKMKLALPRDLSNCAVVTQSDGSERLEIVSSTVLIQQDARLLWRKASQSPPCKFIYPDFKVTTEGESRHVPACSASDALWSREALNWMHRAQVR